MKKTFDCVDMKNKIQEKLWHEAGETIDGLKKLLAEKSNTNKIWLELNERREKLLKSA